MSTHWSEINFRPEANSDHHRSLQLDEENNVDLDSMKERLANMDIDEGLKTDIGEFMDSCHAFSTCVPDFVVNKPVALKGFGRQMLFFSCFKVRHKAMRAVAESELPFGRFL